MSPSRYGRLTLAGSSANMKHLAAYLLLGLGGNTSPSAKDVKGVLDSVGIEADDERLDKLIAELEGKDLQEVYDQGMRQLPRDMLTHNLVDIRRY